MTLLDLVTAEREDLLALLEVLSPQQWQAHALCEGWTVHVRWPADAACRVR